MKNAKLNKLFSKIKERVDSKEPSYARIHVSSPSKKIDAEAVKVDKGSKVHHPEHGHGEVKALLHGGKYASVHFGGDHDGGHYKPVKVEELSHHHEPEAKTKLGKFMAKAGGVHKPMSDKGGSSLAGYFTHSAKEYSKNPMMSEAGKKAGAKMENRNARKEHERVLGELKAMPKPALGKAEEPEESSPLQRLKMLISKKEMMKSHSLESAKHGLEVAKMKVKHESEKAQLASKKPKKMGKASPENMTSAQMQGLKVPQPKAPKMAQKPIQNRPQMPKPKMGGMPKVAGPKMGGMPKMGGAPKMHKVGG